MAADDNNNYLQTILVILQNHLFRQMMFIVLLAIGVAAGIYTYYSIQDPLYRPIDYKVSDKNASAIADILDKANIKFKIDDTNGVLMVAAKDAKTARYKLAAAGIQKDDSFNFSYLNDQSSIGESQFIENARYLRALEGDLVKTIVAIDGISAAKVHIAMPSNNIYADEKSKPTASVFITVGNGLITDKEKVRSIIQIVASSVPGLDPKDVAITDQYGHYLSNSISEDSIITQEHMAYQTNIQSYYEKRIESLINPLVGENRVNVRVQADIDFTQQEEANEKYDPNEKAVRSEETVTEETGSSSGGGAPGSLANSPPTSDSGAKSASSSQGRSQSIKNYELSKTVSYRKSHEAKVTSMSVAVVLDNIVTIDPTSKKEVSKPVDKETINKITDLVKATIGFNEKRGDRVSVVNSKFSVAEALPPVAPAKFYEEAWFWEIVKRIVSTLFALVIFYVAIKKFAKFTANMKVEAPSASSDNAELTKQMRELKQEQINQLKEIASKDPSRVALVLKNWVTEK